MIREAKLVGFVLLLAAIFVGAHAGRIASGSGDDQSRSGQRSRAWAAAPRAA